MNLQIKRILLIVTTTLLISLLFMFVIKKIAIHIGAFDIPDERKVHTKPIPRLGGLGIYFGFLIGYMLFGQHSLEMNAILIGSFVIVITGVIDDIKPIPAKYKFLGQLFGAMIVPFYGGILLKDISAFGLYISFGIFSYPITVLFIVAIINCINLIDGLDGLSGGISCIYFLTIGIISVIMGNNNTLDVVLTFIMLGSTLGYLYHNFYPASIFMGDSGSMFLGYIIAVIALLGFKNVTLTSFVIPVLLLAIPILDTFFAIVRRTLKKQNPFTHPDKQHLHHQILNMNLSQRATVLFIYGIDLLFAAASIVYVIGDSTLGIVIYSVLLLFVIWLVTCTNIIKNHESKKKWLFPKK